MGVATKLIFDNGDLIVERVQDCEPILDRNAALRSMAQASAGTETWGRHVASIPCVIMERWLNEELERGNTTIKMFGPEMDKLVQKKLQDPDWKWLRVDK
jgi:alpha-galactosidase